MAGKTLGAKRKRSWSERPGRSKKQKLLRVASIAQSATSAMAPMLFNAPRTKSVSLLYGDTNFSLIGASNPAAYVFRANSLFDPDFTGVGHQPRGFDQLMALYERYVVTGVKVEAWFAPPIPGESATQYIPYIQFREISTVAAANTDLLESPNTVLGDGCFPSGRTSGSATGIGTEGGKYLTCYFDIVKLKGHGKDRKTFESEPDVAGSSSTNPVDQGYIHIGIMRNNAFAVGGACTVAVRLTYYGTFYQPLTPPES